MKKLGLVGGMGPESTIPYYRGIVYGVRERMGENVMPFLSMESVNVFDILVFCRERRYDDLAEYLSKAIGNLAAAGADFAALSANTPHIVFDQVQKQSPIPLISIVGAACGEAVRRNLTKIGLMGTIFTMEEDFFKKPFTDKGIQIAIPREDEMEYINRKIYTELEFADVAAVDFTELAQSCRTYGEFIEKMARTGPGELRYLGMALLGPRHQVDRLTGSLPLLR